MKKWANIRFQPNERKCKASLKLSVENLHLCSRATHNNYTVSTETQQTDEFSENAGDGDNILENNINETPHLTNKIKLKKARPCWAGTD